MALKKSIRQPEEKIALDPANLVRCSRHEDAECPRCDELEFRPVKRCAKCGEPAGSISAGTGAPLVREREDGHYYHVRCLPGTEFLDAHFSCLESMRS
jgi:hypothetical protein